MRKPKRSDPSLLTAAIRDAAERHERASKRVSDSLDSLQERLRDSDPAIDELDDSDLEEDPL